MGMNIPKNEVLHKYGTDKTDMMLGAADINTVRLEVAQTDWTPTAAKPGDTNMSPGDLLNGLINGDSNAKPKP